jgi:ribosomal protein S27AE
MINRLGTCPNCGRNWDDGDALQNLNKMSVFEHATPGAMKKIAGTLGYSEENKVKFSAVNVHQIGTVTLYECPRMSCKHVFMADTGEEWRCLFDYKVGMDPIRRENDKKEGEEPS